jgi:uncharacterized protein YuzE
MKSRYDPEADALYLSFSDAPIIESEEVRPGIIFDYDAEGRVVGIEVLDAAEHLSGGGDLRTLSAA